MLEEKILQFDAYIGRENLVFSGISEDIGETTERTEDIYVKEDFPGEIDKRRQLLYPILREAKIQKNKTSLIADKLVIECVRYGEDDIDKLPPDFQPKNLATRVGERVILLYGINSPYFNVYCSKFQLDGKTYVTSEQYFQ